MSITHTQAIIATAQCMTDGDAIDFIDTHVTVGDLMEWIEEFTPKEMPCFTVHGAVPEVDSHD
jgi:hypothetical protein